MILSCFTLNTAVFYGRVTAIADEGRLTDALYLEFCNMFNIVPHDILVGETQI